jgi:hypothetical protein
MEDTMMENRSAIIIGKGPSLKRVTSDYVESFDDIIICNLPRYEGYEHILPFRAAYQFRNNSTPSFNNDAIKRLGLKGIFSTTKIGQKLSCDTGNSIVPIHYSKDYMPALFQKDDISMSIRYGDNKTVDPTTGIIAFSWAVNADKYSEICLVGFDMLQVGKDCYYFHPEEYQENIKYLLGKDYTLDGKRKHESLHAPKDMIDYIDYEIVNHKSINFSFVTDSQPLVNKVGKLENVVFIK